VLVAVQHATSRRSLAAIVERDFAPATIAEATDVPAASDALLVRHPDLVLVDLDLAGHAQRGLRLVIDAVALGVPTVAVTSDVPAAWAARLADWGVVCVARGARGRALVAGIEAALGASARPSPRASSLTRARTL
jgi:DNA-binding NarL/FixJ family response regulator